MNMEADELVWEMRKEYGLKLYQTGKLTLSQAAVFCGANLYEFASMLTLSGIPVVSYSVDDLEREVQYFSKTIK
jgi:predicted HTH domain antitoxin